MRLVIFEWLVRRWQRECDHPAERRHRQRVGLMHDLHWCSRCGAHGLELVSSSYARMYSPAAIEYEQPTCTNKDVDKTPHIQNLGIKRVWLMVDEVGEKKK